MMQQVIDATGDSFPLLVIAIWGLTMFSFGMYYTRDLRRESAKKEKSSLSKRERERRRMAHKPA